MRRVLLLVIALLAVPATAEAGTLLSVPAAGGKPIQMVRDKGAYFDTPCWREDGTVIAHVQRDKGLRYGIFRAGAKPRWGATSTDVIGAEFAPGCKLLAEVYYAFGDDRQYDGGVLIRETSGKEIMRLQSRRWPDGLTLTWSPDGTRIAVAMNHRQDRRPGIRVVDVRSRRVLARHATDHGTLFPQAFSPDGGALVFEDGEHLRVLDVATGKVRTLSGGADGRLRQRPAWSPKGDRIAAVNDGGGIELLDPIAGYGPTVPTAGLQPQSLAWSPDDTTLAVQDAPSGRDLLRSGLALVPVAPDGQVRRVLGPAQALSVPVWSPDGTALAVSRRG